MKKIIRPLVLEQSEYFCDVCGKSAVSFFKMDFGYGSDFHMDVIKGDFCDKHGTELRYFLFKKYKKLRLSFGNQ